MNILQRSLINSYNMSRTEVHVGSSRSRSSDRYWHIIETETYHRYGTTSTCLCWSNPRDRSIFRQ